MSTQAVLSKPGMPLNMWAGNKTFHPVNVFGAATAILVNSMTNNFGQKVLAPCEDVMEEEIETWISAASRFVIGNKVWFGSIDSVITVGMMLGKGPSQGERNVLSLATGNDGDDHHDKDSDYSSEAMCGVTMDDPSGPHRAAKGQPQWEWGHVSPRGQKVR